MGSMSSVMSMPISAWSYSPENVDGKAVRNALTMATFSIIVPGIFFHMACPVLNSLNATVVSVSSFRSVRATLAQPPTMVSSGNTKVPLRLTRSLLEVWTITPDSMPANCGCESALLVKASLPTTIEAAAVPYLIRYASLTKGFKPMYRHRCKKLAAS